MDGKGGPEWIVSLEETTRLRSTICSGTHSNR
jgi:hypothetical protein